MKKRILAMLIASVMVLSMAGCGAKASEPVAESPAAEEPAAEEPASEEPAAESEAASGERVKITYAQWGDEVETKNTQAVADIFNNSQDRIEVEVIPIPWETYMEKLNSMATAGELPDTAIMNEAGVIKWAEEDMLYNISSMYDDEPDKRPLDSLTFEYEGEPVAYSGSYQQIQLYYNKDMFDAAGLDYPATDADNAYDWDEFVEVAKKLTLDDKGNTPNDAGFDKNNIVQYGCMIENLVWQLEVWCLSNGSGFYSEDGSKVVINDPAAVEAIQRIADLHLVHNVAPLSTGLTDDGVQRSLVAGTVAMTTNGTWNMGTALSEARDENGLNYGIAVLPYMKDKVTITTGGPTVLFNQSKHPEEAMEWLKWFAQEENNWDSLIATAIWMPKSANYYNNEEDTKRWLENPAYPPFEEAKAVLVDYAKEYSKRASWYYVNNTDDFNALLGSTLGDVWTGKETVKDAIDKNFAALEEAHSGDF